MKTIEKHILEDFNLVPTPEIGKVVIGFDLDGLFKCKNENGNIRLLECKPINATFIELQQLISINGLYPGYKYRMNDFGTIHNILDGNSTTGDIHQSNDEPLILTAISTNTFDKQVYSTLHPQDIIYYDITGGDIRDIAFFDGGSPITKLKGVIYYRKDTIQNVECWYDFRNVKYRRWLVSATPWVASGTYVAKNVYEYESILYKCLVNHTGITTTPDLDTTNWIKWLDKTQNWSWTSDKTQFNIGDITTDNLIISTPIDVYTFGGYYSIVNNVKIEKIYLDYMIDNNGYSTVLNNINFNTINDIYGCYSIHIGNSNYNQVYGISVYCTKIGNNNSSFIIKELYYSQIKDGNAFLIGNGITLTTIGNNNASLLFYIISNCNIKNDNSTITINAEFKRNIINNPISDTSFTVATHVYADYNCEIFRNSAGVLRLKYVDGTDADVIVDITS